MSNIKFKVIPIGVVVALAGATYVGFGISNTPSKRTVESSSTKTKGSKSKATKNISKSIVPTVSEVPPGCAPNQLQLSNGRPNFNGGAGFANEIGTNHDYFGYSITNISSQSCSLGGGLPTVVRSVLTDSPTAALSDPSLQPVPDWVVNITVHPNPGPVFTLYPGKSAELWTEVWSGQINPNYKPLTGTSAQIQQEEAASMANAYIVFTLPTPQGPITVTSPFARTSTLQSMQISQVVAIYPIAQSLTPKGPPDSYVFGN